MPKLVPCAYRLCKISFTPKKARQKFCCDAHRFAEWELNNPRLNTKKAQELLTQAVSTDAAPVKILSRKRPGGHAGRLENSERLQRTLLRLKQGPATTKELSDFTGSQAVHSDISELRQNLRRTKQDITCEYHGRSEAGRKIYIYRLIENVAA